MKFRVREFLKLSYKNVRDFKGNQTLNNILIKIISKLIVLKQNAHNTICFYKINLIKYYNLIVRSNAILKLAMKLPISGLCVQCSITYWFEDPFLIMVITREF